MNYFYFLFYNYMLKILYNSHIARCVSQEQTWKRGKCTSSLLQSALGVNYFKGREGHIWAEEVIDQ